MLRTKTEEQKCFQEWKVIIKSSILWRFLSACVRCETAVNFLPFAIHGNLLNSRRATAGMKRLKIYRTYVDVS